VLFSLKEKIARRNDIYIFAPKTAFSTEKKSTRTTKHTLFYRLEKAVFLARNFNAITT
jgi:hypothetical protein